MTYDFYELWNQGDFVNWRNNPDNSHWQPFLNKWKKEYDNGNLRQKINSFFGVRSVYRLFVK